MVHVLTERSACPLLLLPCDIRDGAGDFSDCAIDFEFDVNAGSHTNDLRSALFSGFSGTVTATAAATAPTVVPGGSPTGAGDPDTFPGDGDALTPAKLLRLTLVGGWLLAPPVLLSSLSEADDTEGDF